MFYFTDIVYYNGEGYDCKYYVRMGGNMMDAYFGNGTYRRMINFDQIRNLPYKVRFLTEKIADHSVV
jgi:hypothetical protein